MWVGNASGVATPTTLADVALSGDYSDLLNTPTDQHVANTDLTLDADRTLAQDTNTFTISGVDALGNAAIMLRSIPDASGGSSLYLNNNDIAIGSGNISVGKVSIFKEDIFVGDGATTSGRVAFRSTPVTAGNPANSIFLKAPTSLQASDSYTLPSAIPGSTQFLSSDSSGNMSWATPVDTNTNIGNTDLTLSDNRVLQLNGNNLAFRDGSTDKLEYVASVGVWSMIASLLMTGDFSVVGDSGFLGAVSINGNNGGGGPSGELRLTDNSGVGGTSVGISAPATLSSDITFTLPSSDGTPGQFLSTDGSGNLSFATGGTGTGDNLANADLTQTAAQDRTYTLADSTFLSFQTSIGTGPSLIRLVDEGSQTNDKIIFQGKAENIKIWGNDGAAAGGISFREAINNGNSEVTIKAAASMGSNYTLTLPDSDGSPNQVLKTDGSGNLDWVDQTTIPALNVTQVAGSGAANRVPFYSTNTTILDTDSDFSFSADTLAVPKISTDQIIPGLPGTTAGDFGKNSKTISKFGGNVTVSAGLVYSMQSGSFARSNARLESTASGMLAVAGSGGGGTSNNTPMVISGFVKLANNTNFSSASVGDPLYLHPTALSSEFGFLTATPPSTTGNAVRIVGYVANPTNAIVYFNPDNSYIVL